jgi:hypothetical protein
MSGGPILGGPLTGHLCTGLRESARYGAGLAPGTGLLMASGNVAASTAVAGLLTAPLTSGSGPGEHVGARQAILPLACQVPAQAAARTASLAAVCLPGAGPLRGVTGL